jgi:uncharacterized protein YegP (UPF0339 family)
MYKIKQAKNGQFYYTFCTVKGTVYNDSEQMKKKSSVVKNIHAVVKKHRGRFAVELAGTIKIVDTTAPKIKGKFQSSWV